MSTSIEPPDDYWTSLAGLAEPEEIAKLRERSEARLNEFKYGPAVLLDRLVDDGWLRRETRLRCTKCNEELTADEAAGDVCPHCNEAYESDVVEETIYVRELAPERVVDWVVALHGMNTTGAWQEAFSWMFGTTWGRSVPVAVYKYGIVVPGVIMPWRRTQLRNGLREKLATLRDEARGRGFSGKPDLIAHSFGTWLIGHVLIEELKRPAQERLAFGRIILAGCALRPDFDWRAMKDAGLVEDVLNHYGTKDPVVPLAHMAIHDSGPSGRRGFDDAEVLNIRAENCGHSDLLEMENLENSYRTYWRPFLRLPRNEFHTLPDRVDPGEPWRPLPWPFRGTLFPLFALPLLLALLALLLTLTGTLFGKVSAALWLLARYSGLGLGVLLGLTLIVALLQRLRRPRVVSGEVL